MTLYYMFDATVSRSAVAVVVEMVTCQPYYYYFFKTGEEDNGRRPSDGNGRIYSLFFFFSLHQFLSILKIETSTYCFVMFPISLQVVIDSTTGSIADYACEVEITE